MFDGTVQKLIKDALKLVKPNSGSPQIAQTSSSSSGDSLKHAVDALNREVERVKQTERTYDGDILILNQRADETEGHVDTVS